MHHLIVVPDGNPIFPAWCIDHAIKLALESNQVHFLNLQELNLYAFQRKIKKLFFRFSRKNRSLDLYSNLCQRNGITQHTISGSEVSGNFESLGLRAKETFELAMSSKYGAVFGSRTVTLKDLPEDMVQKERLFFLIAYLETQRLITDHKIESVSTVNGRLVVSSAVVVAARDLGIQVKILETVDFLGNRYQVFDKSPHDLHEVGELQKKLWSMADDSRDIDAQDFFEKNYLSRLKVLSSKDYTFRESFVRPAKDIKIASFFPTTDTEFPVFSDFHVASTFDGNQRNAFLEFAKIASKHKFQVIVRAHPQNSHSFHLGEKDDLIWKTLCLEVGAEFIGALSGINSYDLIQKSDLCVTYSSSIGIEAVLMGKPLIMLGETDYSNYIPENLGYTPIAIERLFESGVPEVSISALYPWAYWNSRGGSEMTHFKVKPLEGLVYNNQEVDEMKCAYKLLKAVARGAGITS